MDNSLKMRFSFLLFQFIQKTPTEPMIHLTTVPEHLEGTPTLYYRDNSSACSLPPFLTSHPSPPLAKNKTSPWPDFNAPVFSYNSYFEDNSYHSIISFELFLTLPFLNFYLSVIIGLGNSPLTFKHLLRSLYARLVINI